ncbi:MAG: hypothetical protein RR543_00355 [Erysipelotrichales bacterium]
MLLLSREMIEQFYTMEDSVNAVEKAFKLFSNNKVEVPLRTQITKSDGKSVFLCMPAFCEEDEASAVKILGMFPDNIDRGIPTINGQVLVMNTDTGIIESMLNGNYITQQRTGAASGVAFKHLARKDAKKGAMIGTGGQAIAQLEAMLVACNLEEVKVFDRDSNRCNLFVEEMNKQMAKYNVKIVAAKSSDDAIEDADVIIAVTPSLQPVFDGTKVKAGATISGVGSFRPEMQEVPSSLLERASKIYFDSKSAVLSEAGDILIPLGEGLISEDDFTGDIGEVINGRLVGRENDEEIIFFKTVGIAAQDVVIAKDIFEKAKVNKVGMNWE